MTQLADLLTERDLHPLQVVVLVPYAQLMLQAREAWTAYVASSGTGASFMPRFETTMNWASSLGAGEGAPETSADDISLDAAVDVLTAAALLERAGLAAQTGALAGRLMESAWSLAGVAAAQPPEQRLAWGAEMAGQIGESMESSALAFELAVARIALVWASTSSYQSDALFSAPAAFLVVLEGFQSEPLAEALKIRFAGNTVSLKLHTPEQSGALALHAALDAEDEAHRAAACVLAHLAQGRSPVALVAQDRVLTRRIRAMLAERGLALRDETGWKLSTTRAAAMLMGLLRALPWDASTDGVLDWLKNAPAFESEAVSQLEIELRKFGVRFWRAVPQTLPSIQAIAGRVGSVRDELQRARPLPHWLRDIRSALRAAGQWPPLEADAAGVAVMDALRLQEGRELVFSVSHRMTLQDFTSWVNQTLEAASFSPVHPSQAQVVILPLSQLLGRSMQAVVLPGADEIRLAVSPEPPGIWTPAQRVLLGLPSREALSAAQRSAWRYALHMPHIDVLWRTSEGGEKCMPSGFVQTLLLENSKAGIKNSAADPRIKRVLQSRPTPQPLPTGEALPVTRLSASAYEDLRRCPYRFFALRQLKLQEAEELESELGKRDFGNWLHTLLDHFHQALKEAVDHDRPARLAMINVAATDAATALGLSDSEFLPFAAIWPRVRDGYLDWLDVHEATGAVYAEGEVWKDLPLGGTTLIGKIDRIDRLPDGSQTVIDYKTEASGTTRERIKDGQEDTQLAFYAALLPDDTLAAAYVNLGEKEPTRTYAQADIVELRDDLIQSILSDMTRIAEAVPLPALGEGKACEYCAARGLCRKDFWND